MNDALEVPIAEYLANISESRKTGGIAVSATRILRQNKSRVLASCISDCAPPLFEPAIRNQPRVSVRPDVNHHDHCAVITAAHSASKARRRHSIILRCTQRFCCSPSAATLPLNKDPVVTDRAPLSARFSGTPVVHRGCGLARWDRRDSTAQHRRRLHQAESLGLSGRPLERG
jgi:hypothetical protein